VNILPKSSFLGQLEIIEVYEYYDIPIFFACKNRASNIFIALLISINDSSDDWLYVGVSENRFNHFRSGGIDINEVFRNPEDKNLFHVVIPRDFSEGKVTIISPSELTQEQLPIPGEYLHLETKTLPELKIPIDQKAEQAKRDFFRIKLDFPEKKRTEAPAFVLGQVLEAFQESVNAIGQAILSEPTERGQISPDILQKVQMNVVAIGSGSFEVELASENFVNLFDESNLEKILDEFILLINLSAKPEELKDQLTHLKIRTASKYLNFLRSIDSGIQHTNFQWASPKSGHHGNAKLTSKEVKGAISMIEKSEFQKPEHIDVVGKLIGANIDKKTYEIWVKSENSQEEDIYSGKVSEKAFPLLSTATLSEYYRATIEKTTKIKSITGEIVIKYELISLENI